MTWPFPASEVLKEAQLITPIPDYEMLQQGARGERKRSEGCTALFNLVRCKGEAPQSWQGKAKTTRLSEAVAARLLLTTAELA